MQKKEELSSNTQINVEYSENLYAHKYQLRKVSPFDKSPLIPLFQRGRFHTGRKITRQSPVIREWYLVVISQE